MILATRTMSVLTDDEMEQVWQAAWRVLARVPMRLRRLLYRLWRILPFGEE